MYKLIDLNTLQNKKKWNKAKDFFLQNKIYKV